jgi:Rps23 Pro-64 3,4-dihydroxylase Tpa1-like proline 4-hydroxylase
MDAARRSSRFLEVVPMIYVAELLSLETCEDILLEFSTENRWEQARIAVLVDDERRESVAQSMIDTSRRSASRIPFNEIDLYSKPKTQAAIQTIRTEILSLARDQFGLNSDDFGDEEIIHYKIGGKFSVHTDVHDRKRYRAISLVLYLNENFSGGQTEFPDVNYACKPKAGRALAFPSEMRHSAAPVLAGNKFVIIGWVFYPGGK